MIFSDQRQFASGIQDSSILNKEGLLKYLVKKVAAATPLKTLQSTEETVNEVMLEAHIDGACYYLVRSKSKSSEPISLSPRELEIARLVAQGLPNKCIGDRLNISHWTVNTYLRRMFVKSGVTSRAALIARLMEEHLLQGQQNSQS